ncbi:MAG: tRNA-dihydrouridine synthase family protein [Lentisphaerae bacterium]|nr:tRNA-dihydrouridine synthase family protein [Lentisphaerota bacterium]
MAVPVTELDPLMKYRAVLAPMEGVMSPWFIRACGRLRLVDHWITPFFSVTGGAVPSKRIIRKRLAPYLETGVPITAQVLGKDPCNVVKCAVHLVQTGLVAGINLNFSCPSTTVTGNGAGSALLDQLETVESITAEVRKELPETVPLSVKLRSGVCTPAPGDVVKAAVNGGAELIIFHYRTKEEMYHPVKNGWERIRQAVEAAGNIPVIGNGDICSVSDAERMIAGTDCRSVALARAFLGNPTLIHQINGKSDDRMIDLAEEMRRENAPESTIRAIGRLIRLQKQSAETGS